MSAEVNLIESSTQDGEQRISEYSRIFLESFAKANNERRKVARVCWVISRN